MFWLKAKAHFGSRLKSNFGSRVISPRIVPSAGSAVKPNKLPWR